MSNIEFVIPFRTGENGLIEEFLPPSDEMAQSDTTEEGLSHFGVPGMQWGVRRSDKQLARAAAKASRRGRAEDHPDHTKVRDLTRNKKKTLSNDELQAVLKRKDLETRYSQMNPSKLKKGENVVKAVVGTVGTVSSVIALGSSPAGKAAISAAKGVLSKYGANIVKTAATAAKTFV